MNVVTFDPKEKESLRRKEDMLEVLDEMRQQVESGNLREFVACSIMSNGLPQIHVSCLDFPGGVGLYEIGKNLLIADQVEELSN